MKRLLLGLAIATAVAACATTTSPTGRTQRVGAVSQQQLDQMGAQAFAEYKAKLPQSSSASQTAYVRCVVNAITRELPTGSQAQWESALFNNDSPNAFALPGGKVGIYTGIFKVARNQDQLAAVIAHEIGHVVAHHHDERVTRQLGAQTGLGILGALVGSQYGSGAAQATQHEAARHGPDEIGGQQQQAGNGELALDGHGGVPRRTRWAECDSAL